MDTPGHTLQSHQTNRCSGDFRSCDPMLHIELIAMPRRKPNRVFLNHYDDQSMMYPRANALAQDEWKAVGSYLTRPKFEIAEVTNPAESISKGLQSKLL